jgi:predicted Zn-dependent protease
VALDADNLARARARARAARELNPLSPEPGWALSDIEGAAGNDRAAVAYLVEATRLQPENPETWYRLGFTYFALGDQCSAYGALNHSYTLDPRSRLWSKGGPLDVARDAVNAGACEPS